jgi:hypothetical protein
VQPVAEKKSRQSAFPEIIIFENFGLSDISKFWIPEKSKKNSSRDGHLAKGEEGGREEGGAWTRAEGGRGWTRVGE